MRTRLLIFLCVLWPLVASSQIILTEVMFDPDGDEGSDEFIEIYNAGTVSVNLSGWQVGDGESFDTIIEVGNNGVTLLPEQYAIILDADYFADSSATYDALIPASALVLTVDGSTIGSRGLSNSTAETVMLINASQDTLQRYTYTLDNDPGISDEKIELLPDNSTANWGNSRSLHGTPGFRNSLTRGEIDLIIRRFTLLSHTYSVGMTIPFEMLVKNVGRQSVEEFHWQTFEDRNENQQPDEDEIIDNFLFTGTLAVDDSTLMEGEFRDIPFGEVNFGVAVFLEGDVDSSNNVAVQSVFVDDPSRINLVINEIMAEPSPEKEEWIELFNDGNGAVNLANLHFADARDTVKMTDEDYLLPPGEYLVFGGDSSIADQYSINFSQLLIHKRFPTLNNQFDDLRLFGPSYLTYERVNYSANWYGRTIEPGTSLEKLNPSFNGQIADNWAASVSGSTPGRENSVFINAQPAENQLTITPNPFSPDGDGFEDFTAIQFRLGVEIAFVNIRIFDIRGRLIRFLANSEPAAHEGQFVWDGKDDDGRISRIGAYVCFLEALNAQRQTTIELKKVIILTKK